MNRISVIYKTWTLRHYFLFLMGTLVMLFLTVVLRNWEAVQWFFTTTESLLQTLYFVFLLYGGVFTLFSPLGTVIVVLFSVCVSMNSILLVQYIIQQRSLTIKKGSNRAAAYNVSSTIAVALGIGCASCGTAILFSVLSLFGASGIILWLPLHGEELSIIGLVGLLYSTWYLLGKLSAPAVCEIPPA